MNQKRLIKSCVIVLVILLLAAVAFYFIGGEQLRFRDEKSSMVNGTGVLGEIYRDTVVEQKLFPGGNLITGITLYGATYARQNTGSLILEFYCGDKLLQRAAVDVANLEDNALFSVPLQVRVADSQSLLLRVTAPDCTPGNAVTLYFGNTYQGFRAEVSASLSPDRHVRINGEEQDGALCYALNTRTYFFFGSLYWYLVAGVMVLAVLYCLWMIRQNSRGKTTLILKFFLTLKKYQFLIKQLVARDFKTRYKRSVLGVLWSFLNPLLTMAIQYIVFSTLFKSDIPNFPLYLLIGIICYGFFSEATTMALSSIIGNATLITKVYVPKFIYPLTRVISSTINFLLALIPIFLVALFTGAPIRWTILLLPLGISCLFAVSLGIGMILATSMVFFRDTQFLWGVVSMLWMYATPIFYPESILPSNLMPLFKCNPLYHIIRFMRIVLIDGVSPDPKAYLLMLIASFVPLVLGIWIFRKHQDRFVLNL